MILLCLLSLITMFTSGQYYAEFGSISGSYYKTGRFDLCHDYQLIETEEQCREAAFELGLKFHSSWNGYDDFPGCSFANDTRQRVYFNTSPNPNNAPSDRYEAVCKKGSYYMTGFLDLCLDSQDIKTEKECKEAASELGLKFHSSWKGDNDFPGCSFAKDQRGNVYFNTSPRPQYIPSNRYKAVCRKQESTGIGRFEVFASGLYYKTISYDMCLDSQLIQTEEQCKDAASKLGLKFHSSSNGKGDFPGCSYAKGQGKNVYFNTSPYPKKAPKYGFGAICTKKERQI